MATENGTSIEKQPLKVLHFPLRGCPGKICPTVLLAGSRLALGRRP